MKNIASLIDHTILKPDATIEQVEKICEEAKSYEFASVCVNPYYVSFVSDKLKDSVVKTTSVVGFPLGANTTEVKRYETCDAIKNGADEIDMVINIAALKNRNLDRVIRDIEGVVEAADGNTVKVIIETCLLTQEEKILACEISKECGADFVKTSTGFSVGGATIEDVELMKKTVGPNMGVKASGGIKTLKDLEALVKAGANRIGASASVDIINEIKK